jgi:tRNA pseudouridine38-40 synthase
VNAKPQRIKLVIAYDGAAYEGWQIQKIGRGVQQVIEESLERLFQMPFRIHGSSRTDTGVHAKAMVAHVDFPERKLTIPLAKLPLAINSQLPEDVRVMEARAVSMDFHARFSARGKQYRYTVFNHRSMDPLLRRTAWHVPKRLDLPAMRQAAAHFKGKRDWAAFANNRNYEMESTVRTLHRCELRKQGSVLTFIIEGDGFLYKMCRGIVGTIIQVGEGRFAAADIPRMLETRDRSMAGMTAPAHGLILWKVFY